MITFKKILVVTSTDLIQPSVISQSAKIAQRHQSHVTFFNVIEDLPQEQLKWITALPPQELMANVVAEKQISLSDSVNKVQGQYPSVDTSIKIGLPFIETTKKVQQDKYDLVLLAAKSERKPRKSFFGSTTVHLMRKCPCPVLTIGNNIDKPIKKIAAAIDVYAPTTEGRKLNEKIVINAANLATQENAELHVIHAWKLPSADYLAAWGNPSEIDRLEIIMKEKQNRNKHINSIIEQIVTSHCKPITALMEGEAQEKIPEYVKDNDIDLIVMGTVCRTGIPGYFIGNTAESILSEVSCSVLTLKPEGFISPVEI